MRAPPPVTRWPTGHAAVAPVTSPAATVPAAVTYVTAIPAWVPTPLVPVPPARPRGPAGPRWPRRARRARTLRSASASERFLTSDDRTAAARICVAPTLLRGSVTAAYDVPPSAITSAMSATTMDGDKVGRRARMFTVLPGSACLDRSRATHLRVSVVDAGARIG